MKNEFHHKIKENTAIELLPGSNIDHARKLLYTATYRDG